MITFEDVWASYGESQVLRGVTFTAETLKTTALVGPSGSGKSTCLRLIMGFMKADRGRIRIDGQDVEQLNTAEWMAVRRKMGMVFQNSALFDSMTVCQNVGFFPHYVEGRPWRRVRWQALELLRELDLENAADKMPSELSGGMQRRVALARSLIYRPTILLYDEPTTGLDPQMTDVVNDLIREMSERYGVTSIVVSHDLPSINVIADHVVLIEDGASRIVGPPSQLLHSDEEQVRRFASSWREQILAHAKGMAGQTEAGAGMLTVETPQAQEKEDGRHE